MSLGKEKMVWHLLVSVVCYSPRENKSEAAKTVITENVTYFNNNEFERVFFYDFSDNVIYSLVHNYENYTFDFIIYDMKTRTSAIVSFPCEEDVIKKQKAKKEKEESYKKALDYMKELKRQGEAMKATKEQVQKWYEMGKENAKK